MISASTVRELAIGQKIVLKEDAEMVEVVQEKEVTGTETEVSEVIEAIEETEMIEETEGIDGI
jgi:ACT domain-containing protein